MLDALLAHAGTETGRQIALWLALAAAFAHALLAALQKGRFDPWIMRGGIDSTYALIALPFVLFVVPWPDGQMWLILFGSFLLHSGYKMLQAAALSRGAYTVVYPVIRGSAPLFTVLGAGLLFGESFGTGQWAGLAVLVAGILGLGLYNLRKVTLNRATLPAALMLAVGSGLFTATYTTYDAWAMRIPPDPLTFLFWFFFLDGLVMPMLAWKRMMALPRAEAWAFAKVSVLGGILAYMSFGTVLIATRIGNVGEVAVMRETATVFSALIGWLVLKETTGPVRVMLMALIALGAVVVKLAG